MSRLMFGLTKATRPCAFFVQYHRRLLEIVPELQTHCLRQYIVGPTTYPPSPHGGGIRLQGFVNYAFSALPNEPLRPTVVVLLQQKSPLALEGGGRGPSTQLPKGACTVCFGWGGEALRCCRSPGSWQRLLASHRSRRSTKPLCCPTVSGGGGGAPVVAV